MTKFVITGYTRSGTTFLASILNSQPSSFCFEFSPLRFQNFSSQQEEDFFNSRLNAVFINLGMNGPKLRGLRDYESQEKTFIDFFHKKFSTLHAGFKVTLLNKNEIKNLINRGYKIILIKRNIRETFNSNITRIDLNKKRVAMHFKKYLNNLNNYNLDITNDDLLTINFEDLINNQSKVLSTISSFLKFDVIYVEKRYHSFNKNRHYFTDNTSYHSIDKKNLISEDINKRYIDFIQNKFDLKLSTLFFFKNVKEKILK